MGFNMETSISILTVWIQGALSFFSPCVLPLVPLYLGYLAGGTANAEWSDQKRRKVTLRNTVFFVLGISAAFFMLGLGFTALGNLLSGNRLWITRVGGILIFLLGLYQIGFVKFDFLQKERRLPFRFDRVGMNPITAFLLGFVFSFAWTPCVGPALTSVLLLASSAASRGVGFLLIGVYTLGFVLPFLAVGLFTSQVLSFFRKHSNWLRYTAKLGGVLLMFMGIMMFTGWMNQITGYLSGVGAGTGTAATSQTTSETQQTTEDQAESGTAEPQSDTIPAPDFTLVDQYGNTHTLSDYKGKVVFLNFWATWCGPCRQEMPDIQQLYLDEGGNLEDVIILGVAAPKSDDNPFNQETKDIAGITEFLEDGGYTYPVLMDTTGDVLNAYGIQAFPTTFMIDADGNLFGYLTGTMTREIMDSIIEQTKTGVRTGV